MENEKKIDDCKILLKRLMCDTDKNHLLNNLKIFVEEQKTWLRNTLDSVGWKISDLETLVQTDESTKLVPCSINPEHRIPQGNNLLQHEDRCEKKNGKYPEINDLSQLEVTIGYAGIVNYFRGLLISFLFDTHRYVKDSARSIADCNDRFNANLDTIEETGKNRNEEKNKSSTCLKELLAAERDAKRRRAAHRGKRVHSNKKSYVEVLREVILGQMETLNDGSNIETESETIDSESAQKAIIQPQLDSYLGVGSSCYSGNPFKRWINIEEEEQDLIKEIQKSKNETPPDRNRRRERSREKYNKFEKSTHDYDDSSRDRHRHREHFRDDRYRDVYKSGDNRDYYSGRSDGRSRSYYSQYDHDKYLKNKSENDGLEKNHQDDRYSDSHEHSERREKKHKRRSRERSDDDSHSIDRHRKKRKKKKSRERSSHKKKHRKSKHQDSESE